ncbi:MAG: rhodanese-like domain-containing protein [Cyanothece sp. SIO2G6]|nr:rhodanese-like domain-containing protein [Cyanothece sp. SIO2G6]
MTFSSTLIPIPQPIKPQSSAQALKERLDWGEPALTIIDVRSRAVYNNRHITGALSAPINDALTSVVASLEYSRDIYVYGETDEQTAEAATQLRTAGYQNVAELKGGLSGWQAVNGPVEGSMAIAA